MVGSLIGGLDVRASVTIGKGYALEGVEEGTAEECGDGLAEVGEIMGG